MSGMFRLAGRTNRFSAVMEQHLDVVHQSTEECMCGCPFCGGSSSLGFNDVKGLWICFKCGERGTAKNLVEMLEGVYTEPEVELDEISDELRSLERDVQSVQKSLPESYLRRFYQPGRVHEAWRERGFTESLCARWELGYDFLTDRLTIPFRDPYTGLLSGVFYRAVGRTNGPRYQYPKGFARSSSLYGSWFLPDSEFERVVLLEGPTDAINVSQTGEFPVSQYGSSISDGQVRLLHRLGVKSLVLFFDYDRAGIQATVKAEALAAEFSVEKVRWDKSKYCWREPSECPCSRIHKPDPGMLRVKEISKMLERTAGV